jgi:hypothetical protein
MLSTLQLVLGTLRLVLGTLQLVLSTLSGRFGKPYARFTVNFTVNFHAD